MHGSQIGAALALDRADNLDGEAFEPEPRLLPLQSGYDQERSYRGQHAHGHDRGDGHITQQVLDTSDGAAHELVLAQLIRIAFHPPVHAFSVHETTDTTQLTPCN